MTSQTSQTTPVQGIPIQPEVVTFINFFLQYNGNPSELPSDESQDASGATGPVALAQPLLTEADVGGYLVSNPAPFMRCQPSDGGDGIILATVFPAGHSQSAFNRIVTVNGSARATLFQVQDNQCHEVNWSLDQLPPDRLILLAGGLFTFDHIPTEELQKNIGNPNLVSMAHDAFSEISSAAVPLDPNQPPPPFEREPSLEELIAKRVR